MSATTATVARAAASPCNCKELAAAVSEAVAAVSAADAAATPPSLLRLLLLLLLLPLAPPLPLLLPPEAAPGRGPHVGAEATAGLSKFPKTTLQVRRSDDVDAMFYFNYV